tara:strand:+ start:25795 stop:26406 length:612 start_codon:yes stop_codon:yes gene_type:complete
MKYPKIPKQVKGEFKDIVNMVCEANESAANKNFEVVRKRLLLVDKWHTFSEDIKAEFYLVDKNDNSVSDQFEIGNYIKIDIPGPGNPSGDGFDWTEIVNIQNGADEEICPFFSFTIKPCAPPNNSETSTAHFYTDDTSNTFILRCVANCIYLEVHSRNELENTKDVPVLDKLRNKAIALGGIVGLGNLNWAAFTKGLLKPSEN